jgi:hypothetical protein
MNFSKFVPLNIEDYSEEIKAKVKETVRLLEKGCYRRVSGEEIYIMKDSNGKFFISRSL